MTQPDAPTLDFGPLRILLAAGRGEPEAQALLRAMTGGLEVTPGHLREKPALSVIARLTEQGGGRHWWAAGLSASQRVKAQKARKRAAALGVALAEHDCADGSLLLVGPASTDPRLASAERELADIADLATGPSATLNYNPWRRAVRVHDLGGAPTVVKLARTPLTTSASVANALTERGGPALPTRISASGLTLLTPLVDADRLGRVPPQTAGRLLARIHAQPPLAESPALAWPGQLSASVEQLSRLLPHRDRVLRSLARELTERLSRSPDTAAFLHGDYSADQVLLDGDHGTVIDFDRHTIGAPAYDLGSYLAVELMALTTGDEAGAHAPGHAMRAIRDELLAGYLDGDDTRGRRRPPLTAAGTEPWTALHLLFRASEPFRACAPDWRGDIETRLATIAGLLTPHDEESS
ncbi:phosphotransferase family protein [Pseudoclavibacter helvolus]|uniref:phosphotransferase family protein n=1 Tax=Pseudoclavibacter helvolus TaxID=255205 RepID=UPI0024ACAD30|nr:phosphotransferase [Pseudoclavibacter helvolus]